MNTPPPDPFEGAPDIVRAIEEAPPRGEAPLPAGLATSLDDTRRAAILEARRRPVWRPLPWALGLAAALAAALLVRAVLLPGGDPPPIRVAQVTITSPGDSVATTRPTVSWTSRDRPGQRYDVWILPESGDVAGVPALFEAEGVVSPVEFSSLRPVAPGGTGELDGGRTYRVLVCLAGGGRLAGRPIPFRVAPSSPD